MNPEDAAGQARVDVQDPGSEALQDPGFPSGLTLGLVAAVVLVAVALVLSRRAVTPPPAREIEARGALPDAELPATDPAAEPVPVTLFDRLTERMGKTREALAATFDTLFGREVDASLIEDLEEALLIADVGVNTTERILAPLEAAIKGGEDDPAVLRTLLREEIRGLLAGVHAPFELPEGTTPFVLLVVGVNGSGKTTTIGKLAATWTAAGHKVLLAAADTYRAAAAEQLEVWAKRAGADIVRHQEGADPGAVVFDALDAAAARGADIVIVDTAGRLQTARPLMEQLTKVRKVIQKKVPDGPHATFLVVDGTMGQNAMSQAKQFHEATPLSGVVVTKLDGTAKGGMVLAIASEMALPVTFIGIGEQVGDLRPFEVDAFVDAVV